ncbi:MAG: hypothetical protein AAGA58_12835 [Verrucomicrobiota bacterium]
MKRTLTLSLVLGALLANAQAVTTISLASLMDPNGGFTIAPIPTGRVQINLGDGTPGDRDGRWLPTDTSVPVGGAGFDAFPNEENFSVGSLDYDEALIFGTGVETIPILSLDLSGLQTDVDHVAMAAADITGLQAWQFGAIDAGDTVTFTDGVLTSIDVDVTADAAIADFDTFLGGPLKVFNGNLVFSGNDISWTILDTEFINAFPIADGNSTLDWNLSGTVLSVIPEPSSGLLALAAASLVFRRRRR